MRLSFTQKQANINQIPIDLLTNDFWKLLFTISATVVHKLYGRLFYCIITYSLIPLSQSSTKQKPTAKTVGCFFKKTHQPL